MDLLHLHEHEIQRLSTRKLPAAGFFWLDVSHEEVSSNPHDWAEKLQHLTGIALYELHLKDIVNLSHPSHFDSARDYQLLIFRKLWLNENPSGLRGDEGSGVFHAKGPNKRRLPSSLQRLTTQPVAFILHQRGIITIRPSSSRTIELAKQRWLDHSPRADAGGQRLPGNPIELMLRLLNAMVDQYLELRQPLTQQLDRWQHALLDPRRPFNNWMALLDSRVELRKLESLSEEQHDAMQELRDHIVDTQDINSAQSSLLLVRTNDVMEHINRVLNHARRLEESLESAVQIHFAAMAHQTSEIMRTLTIITALFMPLTLITGIFGMNFEHMPLLKEAHGFGITMIAMAVIVVLLLVVFHSKRYFEQRVQREWFEHDN